MVRFPEAHRRLFKNKFVCKNCKSTVKAGMLNVLAGKIKCRKCNRRNLRVKRKK